MKIAVVLEGGIVRGVWSDTPCEVTVIDHDVPDQHQLKKNFPVDDDPSVLRIDENTFVRAYVEDSYPLSDLLSPKGELLEVSNEAYKQVH